MQMELLLPARGLRVLGITFTGRCSCCCPTTSYNDVLPHLIHLLTHSDRLARLPINRAITACSNSFW